MSQPDQARNGRSEPNPIFGLVRDISAVATVGLILLIVHDHATPFFRGFFCDDETIRYPHSESTVSSGLCYSVGSLINIILILFIEYQNLIRDLRTTLCQEGQSTSGQQQFPIKLYLHRVLVQIIVWLFGAFSSELITDISKFTVGRLRPHFLQVCNPMIKVGADEMDLNQYCDNPQARYKYITEYRCASDKKNLRDIRLSFMSGHSSYSAFSAAYAVLYIQANLDVVNFGLAKHAIQVLIASLAFYTGLTRVSDYKHHWQDVLTGLSQGTLVAIIISLCLRPAYLEAQARLLKRPVAGVASNSAGDLGSELARVNY